MWTLYLLSQKSISVLTEACFALNYFSSACRLRDGWRLLYKTMERRCLKHMMMSMGMGGLRLFPSKRRYLPQQQRGSEAPLTETFHLLFRSLTQAEGRYLSLGTRDSSRSSSSKVTGQIWVPLMPGSTSSHRAWMSMKSRHIPDFTSFPLRGKRLTLVHSEKHLSWLNTQGGDLSLWRTPP